MALANICAASATKTIKPYELMNMPAPFFSIIVPVYNRPAEVSDLCESLLAQTDTDFELVIVEDGSTVDCRAMVEDAPCRRGLRAEYFYKATKAAHSTELWPGARPGSYFPSSTPIACTAGVYIATLKEELRERPLDCFEAPMPRMSRSAHTEGY